MKAYQDTSIFQGIVEYEDDFGTEWRREASDCVYTFFRRIGDSFLCEGTLVRKSRRSSIKCVHDAFIDSE